MKILAVTILVSFSAFAQLPKIPDGLSGLKAISKQVLDACKEDKSKIKGCEAYTDMAILKVCLMENKEKLSDKCKKALQLVR